MHISKLDLYKSEWLDLVFDQRNKAYGAYELRQHYGNTMSKAMGATFLSLGVVIAIGFVLHKPAAPVEIEKFTVVKTINFPPIEHPKLEQPKTRSLPPAKPVTSIKYVVPVITAQPVTAEPPKMAELEKASIGPVDIKVPGGGTPEGPPATAPEGPGGSVAQLSATVVDASVGNLEFMPEPVGGAAAWSKFLQRNIRYPSAASEQGTMGKVWLSFIIERDGKLSNIEVIKPAGSGFDEEALRVLKLAPAWRPGKQNGQAVRVRYSIPINFTISD